jgi:hypothetical protein
MWPHYKTEHMAYVDGPRLARVLDSVLIGSLWSCLSLVESGFVAIRPASRTEPD